MSQREEKGIKTSALKMASTLSASVVSKVVRGALPWSPARRPFPPFCLILLDPSPLIYPRGTSSLRTRRELDAPPAPPQGLPLKQLPINGTRLSCCDTISQTSPIYTVGLPPTTQEERRRFGHVAKIMTRKFQYVNHAGIEGAGGSAFRKLEKKKKKKTFNQDDVRLKPISWRFNHFAALSAAACSPSHMLCNYQCYCCSHQL